MSFGLNDFTPSEGNYISKILLPGSHTCKILDLRLEKTAYDAEQFNLVFMLEGPELGEDFVGININRLDPTKGTHKGQVATVKASAFAFKNWNWKGKDISRDETIKNFLGTFLAGVGLLEEFQALSVTATSIGELVEEVKSFICGKKDWTCAFTIAGQRYYKEGSDYPNYSLFLPKRAEGKLPYAASMSDPKFLPFNETIHITERKVTDETSSEVEGFTPPPTEMFGTPIPATAFTPASSNGTTGVNDLQLP